MSGESWLPEYSDDYDDEIAKHILEGNNIQS